MFVSERTMASTWLTSTAAVVSTIVSATQKSIRLSEYVFGFIATVHSISESKYAFRFSETC